MAKSDPTYSTFYTVGGTMRPDSLSYIVRKADKELYEHASAGDFCYVLTSRQMGKSSLMVRTAKSLQQQGVHTAILDLTQIGAENAAYGSADAWYYGIAYRILRSFGIRVHLSAWWQERQQLPAVQRLTECLSDLVLTHTAERLAVFVDEVDTTMVLPFTDDFFAAIRACYNARATTPAYQRLSFVLLGVASPPQLVKDTRRTPFNIGYRIDLMDFTFDEAWPLAQGLVSDRGVRETILRRILYWTRGHPYLTQKLCYAAMEAQVEADAEGAVDRLVEQLFFAPAAQREEYNLAYVRDYLTQNQEHKRALLQRYRRAHQGKKVVDRPHSRVVTALKLSGVMVAQENQTLRVRNRIYERVFTAEWAKASMPRDWNRRVAVAAVIVLILGFAVWYTQFLPRLYIRNLQTASEDYAVTYDNYSRLRAIPSYADHAADLFARFWERRAIRAEARGNRDEALLARLRALHVHPTARLLSEVGHLAGDDYANLRATSRHQGAFEAVAFSPDGEVVVTGSGDGTVQLWQAETGEPLDLPIRHEVAVGAVAFSPNERTVVTGGADGMVRLWRVKTGASIGQTLSHEAAVRAVAFSPDGQVVMTGSEDGVVQLWHMEAGDPLGSPLRHGAAVRAVAFSRDGETVITGGEDKVAYLWHVETGKPLGPPLRHGAEVRAVALGWDGRTVVTGSKDGMAQMWQAETGKPLGPPLRHGAEVRAVALSPDGRTVVVGGKDGTAQLWEAETGVPLFPPLRHRFAVVSVAFSPDGQTVVTGSQDGTARLWQTVTRTYSGPLFRHEATVRVVAFGPQEQDTIAIGGADGAVQVWRRETREYLGLPLRHRSAVSSVAFSPNGRVLMVGGKDGTGQLWAWETGEPLGAPLRHRDEIVAVAFSPDGQTVVTGSRDRTAQVWRVETGEPLAPPLRHRRMVGAVAFGPDGQTVVTGSAGQIAQVWRVETGEPLAPPLIHAAPVWAVAFNPDGRTVVTGSGYGTVQLWQTETGRAMGSPLHHAAAVRAVRFSPDSSAILTLTHQWAHLALVQDGVFKLKASRLLAGGWTGAYRWLHDTGHQIQVASLVTGDAVIIDRLQFDSPDAVSVSGEPEVLLEEWQEKLAQKFDAQGKMVPVWPGEDGR